MMILFLKMLTIDQNDKNLEKNKIFVYEFLI